MVGFRNYLLIKCMTVWNRVKEYIQCLWYKSHRFFNYMAFYLNKDFYSWYIHPEHAMLFPASCRSYFTKPVSWKYDPITHRLTHLLSSPSDHQTYRLTLLSATIERAGNQKVADMDHFLTDLTIRTTPSFPPTMRTLTLAWCMDGSTSLCPTEHPVIHWMDEEAQEHSLPVFGTEDPVLPIKKIDTRL